MLSTLINGSTAFFKKKFEVIFEIGAVWVLESLIGLARFVNFSLIDYSLVCYSALFFFVCFQ